MQRSAAEATARLRSRMEVSRILHELPKPTIAMVNGPAAGAGLALALACDLRIAGTSARLVTAFVKVGFSGDFGGSFFLTRLVGTAKRASSISRGARSRPTKLYRSVLSTGSSPMKSWPPSRWNSPGLWRRDLRSRLA